MTPMAMGYPHGNNWGGGLYVHLRNLDSLDSFTPTTAAGFGTGKTTNVVGGTVHTCIMVYVYTYSCVIPLAHNCRAQSAYRKPVYSSKEEEKNIRFLFTALWDHVRSNVKIKGYSGIARFRIEVFRDFGDWLTGSSQPEACRVFTSHGRCALHIMWQPTSMNLQHPNRPSVSSNPIRYLDVET